MRPATEAKRKNIVSHMSVATTPPPELMHLDRILFEPSHLGNTSDSAKLPMKATSITKSTAHMGECHLSFTSASFSGRTLSKAIAKTILEEVKMNSGISLATQKAANTSTRMGNQFMPFPNATKVAMFGIHALGSADGKVAPP